MGFNRRTGACVSVVCASILSLLITAGCSSSDSAQEQKQLQSGYSRKNYSVNDVPPEQRAIVKGFMEAGKKGTMPASSPASASGK